LQVLGAVGAACRVVLDGAELIAAETAIAGFAHGLRNGGDGVAVGAVGAVDGDLVAASDGEDVSGFLARGQVTL
jgi:hypothetical protein